MTIATASRLEEFNAETATIMEIVVHNGVSPMKPLDGPTVTAPNNITLMATFTGYSHIFGGELLFRVMKDFSPRLSIKTIKPHADERVVRRIQLGASDLTTGTFASYWVKSLNVLDVEHAMEMIAEQIKDYNSDYNG